MSAVATVQRLRHPHGHEGWENDGVPAQGTFSVESRTPQAQRA